MRLQNNLSLPVFPQLSFLREHFILKRRFNIINKINLVLPEQKKFSSLAIVKTDFYTLEIRQPFSYTVLFKIFYIPFKDQCLSFVPRNKRKGTCAYRMTAEI